MKPNELLDAIGHVDDEHIKNARIKPKTDKKIWITAASVAACLCIVAAGVMGLNSIKKLDKIGLDETFTDPTTTGTSAQTTNESTNIALVSPTVSESSEKATEESTSKENITELPSAIQHPCQWADTRKRNNNIVVMSQMNARIWPWNCQEVHQQFTSVEYNGRTYIIRSHNTLSKDKVNKKLGSSTMQDMTFMKTKNTQRLAKYMKSRALTRQDLSQSNTKGMMDIMFSICVITTRPPLWMI